MAIPLPSIQRQLSAPAVPLHTRGTASKTTRCQDDSEAASNAAKKPKKRKKYPEKSDMGLIRIISSQKSMKECGRLYERITTEDECKGRKLDDAYLKALDSIRR